MAGPLRKELFAASLRQSFIQGFVLSEIFELHNHEYVLQFLKFQKVDFHPKRTLVYIPENSSLGSFLTLKFFP